MKKVRLSLVAMGIAATSLFAFSKFEPGSIKGTVSPAEFAAKVWAISSTDTFQAKIDKGVFEIKDLAPGNYKIIIEATTPYKSIGKEGVPVADGKPTDVGQIQLSK
jgi:hypothetical protein